MRSDTISPPNWRGHVKELVNRTVRNDASTDHQLLRVQVTYDIVTSGGNKNIYLVMRPACSYDAILYYLDDWVPLELDIWPMQRG